MHRDTSIHISTDDRVGYRTEAFERLHHAATSGAPTGEVDRLAAAELAELFEAEWGQR